MKKLDQIKQTISNHMRLHSQELSNLMKELKQLSDKELLELWNDVELHWEAMWEMTETIENDTDQFHWNNRSKAIRTIKDFVWKGCKRELDRLENLSDFERFSEDSDESLLKDLDIMKEAVIKFADEQGVKDLAQQKVDTITQILTERGVA